MKKKLHMVCFVSIVFLLWFSTAQAASLLVREDFEDNNFLDTFGGEEATNCNCLENSHWIIQNSCIDDWATVTPHGGSRFLAAEWKPGITNNCSGSGSQCGNGFLRLIGYSAICGKSINFNAYISSEYFIRFWVKLTGPWCYTGYGCNDSWNESHFKLLYSFPDSLCIQASVSSQANHGNWNVYSSKTPVVYNSSQRPPFADKAWHKIEIYMKAGSPGRVTVWCDDISVWDGAVSFVKPAEIGLMYNDSTNGFKDYAAPFYIDDLELYTDAGTDFPNSCMADGTINDVTKDEPPSSPKGLRIVK